MTCYLVAKVRFQFRVLTTFNSETIGLTQKLACCIRVDCVKRLNVVVLMK